MLDPVAHELPQHRERDRALSENHCVEGTQVKAGAKLALAVTSQLKEFQSSRVVGGELTWHYRDPVDQVLGLLLGEAPAFQDEIHHPRATPTLDMESRVKHHAAGRPEPPLDP